MTTLEIVGIVADIITIGASVVIIAVCADILKTLKK
jgi:hypothetical protein